MTSAQCVFGGRSGDGPPVSFRPIHMRVYVKIRGQWVYLYRAVDRGGKTVDFRLSTRRDVAAAKAFFRKAVKSQE